MNIFGIGSAELLLLLFFAGVILGPRRVVTLARELGKLVGQVRSLTAELTRQVHREIALLDATEIGAHPPAQRDAPAPQERELPEAYQRFRDEFPDEGELGEVGSATASEHELTGPTPVPGNEVPPKQPQLERVHRYRGRLPQRRVVPAREQTHERGEG